MAKTFGDFKESGTLIVDSMNLCFRFKHAKTKIFAEEFEKTVRSLAHSYKCDNIVIAADWGASTYRRELYPNYKGDRKEKFAEQSEQERADFEAFFLEYENTLEHMRQKGFKVFRFKGVEADDIAAYLVKYKTDDNIWLISSDRDWDLLIQEGVSRFSYVTRKEVTIHNWSEHYDVTPEEYISYKCLVGDAGDSIPGVAGIGPVRAAALIKQYGSAYDIVEALPISGKAKYIQNLNASKEIILLNYQLMDLVTYCDEALGEHAITLQ